MNLHDEARPLTAEDLERSKRAMQMRGLASPNDTPDEVFEIDDRIREAMEADDAKTLEGVDDPAVLAQRLDALKGIVWNQEARMRALQARLDEIDSMETQRGTLTQRIQSLESNVNLIKRHTVDKRERANKEPARSALTGSYNMNAWRYVSLAKAQAEVIEIMFEGGERFELMSHIHIQDYGDGSLDFPKEGQHIEIPDFLVLDALPEVLRQAFMAQFTPVASLIRGDENAPLSLARFEDWQTFAKTFA
jgi:hypothetical protein